MQSFLFSEDQFEISVKNTFHGGWRCIVEMLAHCLHINTNSIPIITWFPKHQVWPCNLHMLPESLQCSDKTASSCPDIALKYSTRWLRIRKSLLPFSLPRNAREPTSIRKDLNKRYILITLVT